MCNSIIVILLSCRHFFKGNFKSKLTNLIYLAGSVDHCVYKTKGTCVISLIESSEKVRSHLIRQFQMSCW